MITKDPRNILIADDSIFFRTRLSDILTEAGHSVRLAKEGVDVIKELEGGSPFDLLVLDIQLSNVDGFGVIQWMKENSFSEKVPVLAVTGAHELPDVLRRLGELGVAGVISKASTPEQIVHRINMLLFQKKKGLRLESRVPVTIPVDFSIGERCLSGLLLNISSVGTFLHTREDIAPGTIVGLRFSLPGIEKVFELKSVVKWSTKPQSDSGFFGGYGLVFTSISPEDQELLRSFVAMEAARLDSAGRPRR